MDDDGNINYQQFCDLIIAAKKDPASFKSRQKPIIDPRQHKTLVKFHAGLEELMSKGTTDFKKLFEQFSVKNNRNDDDDDSNAQYHQHGNDLFISLQDLRMVFSLSGALNQLSNAVCRNSISYRTTVVTYILLTIYRKLN